MSSRLKWSTCLRDLVEELHFGEPFETLQGRDDFEEEKVLED
jgi:hypothetical protein